MRKPKQCQTSKVHKMNKVTQFYQYLLDQKKNINCFGINYELRIIAREFPVYSIFYFVPDPILSLIKGIADTLYA